MTRNTRSELILEVLISLEDSFIRSFCRPSFSKTALILISVLFTVIDPSFSSAIPTAPNDTSIILMKTRRPSRDNKFNFYAPRCDHFKDLLIDANYVVDKSLLIEKIMSYSEDILIISAPPSFGKTANLGMMQLFFEYQIKDDVLVAKDQSPGYKYFKYGRYAADDGLHVFSSSPLISYDEKFVEQYQGNHPVIYLDFKLPKGESYPYKIEPIKNILCEKISLEFKRHFYVQKYFIKLIGIPNISDKIKQRAKEDWKRFELFALNRQLDWYDIAESFRFLSRVLCKFSRNKVVVLIDELDFLVNHLKETWIYQDEPRPKEEDSCVIKFLQNFLYTTFSGNNDLLKVIITSQTQSCIDELFIPVERSIRIFDGVNNPLGEFYGFTEHVSGQLLEIVNVSRELTIDAMKWYSGYKFDAGSNHTILCPWDVIQVMEKKLISDYWVKANADKGMCQLMVLEFMEPTMKVLLEGESIRVSSNSIRFYSDDFMRIFELVYERIARPTEDDVELVLKRLYAAAYLTLARLGDDEDCRVKVPNREIADFIRETIKRHKENFFENG